MTLVLFMRQRVKFVRPHGEIRCVDSGNTGQTLATVHTWMYSIGYTKRFVKVDNVFLEAGNLRSELCRYTLIAPSRNQCEVKMADLICVLDLQLKEKWVEALALAIVR